MLISEGVAIVDAAMTDLQTRLLTLIGMFASMQHESEYCTHSNNVVRELVQPALYLYVKGVLLTLQLKKIPPRMCILNKVYDSEVEIESIKKLRILTRDYWGREYEVSATYQ